MAEERLQKILSRLGVASRRKAEELIVAGKVQVNGKTIVELGSKADPEVDDIRVVGMNIRPPRQQFYILLHKPKNCVTTTHDPQGRETVMDFLKGFKERVYPIGRLDYGSEGALLLTNDGDFANAILSAKSHVTKIYEAKVTGYLTAEQEEQFRTGVPLHGRRTAPAGLKLIRRAENPWYEVTLIEGRTNQIRIMFKYFGVMVEKLRRTQIGFLKLGTLEPTDWRFLTPQEVHRFKKTLKLPTT
ncbi:MAG: rRNA pseudouridine synthase [Bryobacterales bacterium]|nr:rRNA pseudouridine synthase [Bryobacterales bacterium]